METEKIVRTSKADHLRGLVYDQGWQKQNDAAELAVIYQTHEKELALNDAQSETRIHHLLLATAILFILLIGYLFWRTRKYNKELLEKNRQLLADIEQRELEEQQTTRAAESKTGGCAHSRAAAFRRICDLMESSERI